LAKATTGSVFGGMLLITGSCIGAGMLALPILTGLSGFYPSLIAFFGTWAFMTLTALLLVEVNGRYSKRVNLVTMVGQTLGKKGKFFCWILYLFLFYSLLLAYIAGIGSLVGKIAEQYFHTALPDWAGGLFFVESVLNGRENCRLLRTRFLGSDKSASSSSCPFVS
jgi:tyrosine-specific transport protein